MAYATQRTTRLAGFVMAVLMATVVNGSVLWKMDNMAQSGSQTRGTEVPSYITLETVTVVGHLS
jgi:CHASE3 domain sensor protein